MFDIAPAFREVISQLPVDALREMRDYLEAHQTGSAAAKAATFDISVEILKRKWGCVYESSQG